VKVDLPEDFGPQINVEAVFRPLIVETLANNSFHSGGEITGCRYDFPKASMGDSSYI